MINIINTINQDNQYHKHCNQYHDNFGPFIYLLDSCLIRCKKVGCFYPTVASVSQLMINIINTMIIVINIINTAIIIRSTLVFSLVV